MRTTMRILAVMLLLGVLASCAKPDVETLAAVLKNYFQARNDGNPEGVLVSIDPDTKLYHQTAADQESITGEGRPRFKLLSVSIVEASVQRARIKANVEIEYKPYGPVTVDVEYYLRKVDDSWKITHELAPQSELPFNAPFGKPSS